MHFLPEGFASMPRPTLSIRAAASAAVLLLSSPALAIRPDEPVREVAPVPPEIAGAEDVGRLDPDVPLGRAMLVLRRRDPGGLARLLAAQQDPSSADFRRWLTPEEFGARFGATDADVDALKEWLEGHGLVVDEVARGRSVLLFSGRASDVERAFGTELREVRVNGGVHVANVSAAVLPASLAARTAGLSLNNLRPRRPVARRSPAYNVGGSHYLAPADVWTLYGVDALLAAGTNGAGRSIAVAGDSNVKLDDTRYFRSYFGLPANDPQVVVTGPDPGIAGNEAEADIDLQWAGALAPGARVTLVTAKDTAVAYGVDLAVQYVVDQNLADVVSLSFGACEADFVDSDTTFYTNVWAQAAAQGITVAVASGDSGAAGCGPGANAAAASVNGLGSSPYATCVGGTQFLDDSSASWSSTNDPVTKKSVKGPIAETTWNQSSNLATGGGVSTLFARPPWQDVAGTPSGTMRVVPDVSLNASTRNAYAIVRNHTSSASGLEYYGGTSVSAPALAGIAALLAQREGGRIGNLNPLLYAVGAAQYGTISSSGSGSGPFRDVTTGSNGVSGTPGYAAGTGYDAATGLGSLNATALAAALPPASAAGADVALTATPGVTSVAAGGSAVVTLSLAQPSGAADAVATVSVSGLPSGMSASFSPSNVADATAGVVSRAEPTLLTLGTQAAIAPGTYRIDLAAAVGGVTRRVSIFVTVGAAAAPPPGPGVQAPVVLDVYGAASSHYTSDLVAVNRGAADATLLLRFAQTPAPSAPGPVIARSLPAGRELYVPDVIAFLDENGYDLPADGSAKIGTLFATFVGASDPLAVFVGSRTSTPNPNRVVGGAFGTFSGAVPTGGATSGDAWVYGLRENAAFRSNLALVHAPGAANGTSSGPVGLEIQIYDGDSGGEAGGPIAVTLQPGEFHQINSVLRSTPVLQQLGVTNGYARVRRTSGADRFIAYGVVNDGAASGGGTSDGSFLPANATEGLLPIVLDLPGTVHYTSDLTLANPTDSAVNVSLTYTASAAFPNAGGSGTVTVPLAPRRQLVVANAVAYLRSLGLAIPADGGQGGTLLVAGAPALARTSNPNPDASVGGTFGLAYPAVGAGSRARAEAWVYGLRQDADARTNLAIADARAGSGAGVEYVVDVFDSDSGATAPVLTKRATLSGGQWTQFNTILAEAGVVHGYVRVRPSSGTSDYAVYGVVNDGPTAGSRTSDGSYVPMVVVN